VSVLKVPVQFEFINKLNDSHYCKPWLSIEPSRGFIHISQYSSDCFHLIISFPVLQKSVAWKPGGSVNRPPPPPPPPPSSWGVRAIVAVTCVTKVSEMIHLHGSHAIFHSRRGHLRTQIASKLLAMEALPQTAHGELTALPPPIRALSFRLATEGP